VLRHQIDLAVVLAEDDGAETAGDGTADGNHADGTQADASDQAPAAGPDGEDNALAGSSSEG